MYIRTHNTDLYIHVHTHKIARVSRAAVYDGSKGLGVRGVLAYRVFSKAHGEEEEEQRLISGAMRLHRLLFMCIYI